MQTIDLINDRLRSLGIESLEYELHTEDDNHIFDSKSKLYSTVLSKNVDYKFDFSNYTSMISSEYEYLDSHPELFREASIISQFLESSRCVRKHCIPDMAKFLSNGNADLIPEIESALLPILDRCPDNDIPGDIIGFEEQLRTDANNLITLCLVSNSKLGPKHFLKIFDDMSKCKVYEYIHNSLINLGLGDFLDQQVNDDTTIRDLISIYCASDNSNTSQLVLSLYGKLKADLGIYYKPIRGITDKFTEKEIEYIKEADKNNGLSSDFMHESLVAYASDRKSLFIEVPTIYYNKIVEGVERIKEDDEFADNYGIHAECRMRVALTESLKQKSLYVTSLIYSQLRYISHFNRKLLCVELAHSYMTSIMGDCTRSNTVIGWQSISRFLCDIGVMNIIDRRYFKAEDPGKSTCMAYTLCGMETCTSKPLAVNTPDDNLVRSTGDNKFTYDELKMVIFEIKEKRLLRALALRKSRGINPSTVLGMQSLCLLKLEVTDESYANYLEDVSQGTYDKNKFLEAVRNKKYFNYRTSQSAKTNRIFTGVTCMKKDLRKYLSYTTGETMLQYDAHSSQLTLAALDYASKTGDRSVMDYIIKNDIYTEACKVVSAGLIDGVKREISRTDMKKSAFQFMFSNKYSDYKGDFYLAINILLPEFTKYIRDSKGYNKISDLASRLQKLESSIFVGKASEHFTRSESVLGILYSKGYWALSIHDSIVFLEKDTEVVYELLKSRFRAKFANLELTDDQLSKLIILSGLGD